MTAGVAMRFAPNSPDPFVGALAEIEPPRQLIATVLFVSGSPDA
jgi:hypothetical protein